MASELSSTDRDKPFFVACMRALSVFGALCCALAVAGGAYAMHANVDAQNRERLALSALFLFAHGLALGALAPSTISRWRQFGLFAVASGVLLFSGSLALAAFFGISPALAPFGGSLLILGWLLIAVGLAVG